MRKFALILVISAAGLQGNKKESAALSRVMKNGEKIPGTLKIKDSQLVSGEFVSITGGRLDFMGMRGLKCYK